MKIYIQEYSYGLVYFTDLSIRLIDHSLIDQLQLKVTILTNYEMHLYLHENIAVLPASSL